MDLTAQEVKQFWRDFCERHGLDDSVVAKGEAKIAEDPDYWADQTMGRLLEVISN